MSIATKRGDSGQTGLTGGDEELRTLTKELQRRAVQSGLGHRDAAREQEARA